MKRIFIAFGLLAATAGTLLLGIFFYYLGVTNGVTLDPEKLRLETARTVFLDAEGRPIEQNAAKEDVPFSEFPAHLPNAFVSVEDKHFYTHGGVDLPRILKAAVKNAVSLSFREGASTISQQLIKNTHLSGEKTLKRKFKEFKLTRALEKNYSKEEIMELYLNSIYFGHSAFGINEAAHFYFGKKPANLTAGESALLAALVKSPNRYSPFKAPETCLARRNFVLSLMRDQGYLDEREFTDALLEALPTEPHSLGKSNDYLTLAAEELDELLPDRPRGALLTVFTAYDPALQKTLEDIACDSDLCALVRSVETDALRAVRATAGLMKRLPASTVKPLLVYGPAIEEDLLSPATPLLDERTDFGGYFPDDAGGASGKYVSARYALSRSINIPAVRVLNSLGVERGVSYLGRMGMEVGREDYSLALALGGMREGFTLKQLADGYATFASGGSYAPSGTVLRVETDNGRVLYERTPHKTPVFSEDTSFLVTDMLRTAAREGTARRLASLPFPVAAKTGTHEGAAGNLDAYTIAYTTKDVVAVWMGNADNSPVGASGGGLPANAALSVLQSLYPKAPPDFEVPTGVVKLPLDAEAYEREHRLLRADPVAPPVTTISDYFRTCALPAETSTKFSVPAIPMPQISVENGSVTIVLCHAEYYDYVVKRENRGQTATIYTGKYRERIVDNSVRAGERYVYTVTPYYKDRAGKEMTLKAVSVPKKEELPDDWWD